MVWETSLPRRIVRNWQVSFDPKATSPTRCDLLMSRRLNNCPLEARQVRPVPAIAHVCHLSRTVALEHAVCMRRGRVLSPAGEALGALDTWIDLERDTFFISPFGDASWTRWERCAIPAARNVAVRLDDLNAKSGGSDSMFRVLDRDCPFMNPRRKTAVVAHTCVVSDSYFAKFSAHLGFESDCVLLSPGAAPDGVMSYLESLIDPIDLLSPYETRLRIENAWALSRHPDAEDESDIHQKYFWECRESLVPFEIMWLVAPRSSRLDPRRFVS